jgi:hypothetical protein
MLTGWDLTESCNDQHKRRAGVWIESFSYVRVPGDSHGTLRYTVVSAFGDKSPEPFFDRLQVDVLGINLIQPTINFDPDDLPDLQPGGGFIPGGTVIR